ncbi:MAG TPA: hypothetical protein DIT89_04160 [Planctomycetaceae bacterium]|nr:hypothetical protein [Planctomycetaceae bacterium]
MRSSPESLIASLPIGTLLGTPVRLSALILVAAIAAGWQQWDPVAATLVLTTLVGALLLQSIVWLVAARKQGLYPGSLQLWPGGRICTEAPLPQDLLGYARCSVAVIVAGCVSTAGLLLLLWQRELLTSSLLLPLTLPLSAPTDDFATRGLRLGFVVNWNLLLVSLFPARPQDLGHVLHVLLCRRLPYLTARSISARLGMFCSAMCVLCGFVFGQSSLLAFGAFLTLLQYEELRSVNEATLMARAEQRFKELAQLLELDDGPRSDADSEDDDDLTGPLFENSFSFHSEKEGWINMTTRDDTQPRPSREERDEAELDAILTKLHASGRDSLNPVEIGILNRLSQRFRQRKVRR